MGEARGVPRVGTAGWSIPRAEVGAFPGEGSHLARYARVMPCAEINSSFHRPHRMSTYARWAAATPEGFRFSAKAPKTITHEAGFWKGSAAALYAARQGMRTFLEEVGGLGERLGPLLFQLPPKRSFDAARARELLMLFRELYPEGTAVLEPRHASWFGAEAEALLGEFRIGRVAADPAVVPEAAAPGGWPGVAYHRLHGSPRMYYSAYSTEFLDALAAALEREAETAAEVWCVFDNTASGAAAGDALRVKSATARAPL